MQITPETSTNVHADLEQLKQMITNSQELLELGLIDSISQKVEMTRNNPLQLMFDTISNMEAHISTVYLHTSVVRFFRKHKRIIQNVFRTDNSVTVLHYTIVLKKDTTENRHKIREFLLNYENLSFAHRFKIIFQFVPEEYKEQLKFVNEINLS